MDHRKRSVPHEDLRRDIAARLNIHARTFDGAIRRAGRLLPRSARAAAADLAAIEARMAHPKLAARTDPALIAEAADRFRASLAAYKPGQRAARDRAFLMAEIGVKLVILIGAGLALLYWQTSP